LKYPKLDVAQYGKKINEENREASISWGISRKWDYFSMKDPHVHEDRPHKMNPIGASTRARSVATAIATILVEVGREPGAGIKGPIS
jgi:hypothetical protein